MISLNEKLDRSFRDNDYRIGKETRFYVLTANLINTPYKVFVVDGNSFVRETEADTLAEAKIKGMELLKGYKNEYKLSEVTMCHFKENRGWEKDRDHFPERYENENRHVSNKGVEVNMNEVFEGSFNLSSYQAIFNESETASRCRSVLENIHVEIKPFFEQFCKKNFLLTGNRFIRDYSDTLSTTYSDSRNPKYEEKKKNSSTGKKYYIALNERIGLQEVNLLTLEFNGVDQKLYISVDSTFFPIWYLMRTGKMMSTIHQLPEEISFYFQTEWFKKEIVSVKEFENVFSRFKKQRKRPYYHFGIELPLIETLQSKKLEYYLFKVWDETLPIRERLKDEKVLGEKANYILNLFAEDSQKEDTVQLLNNAYSLIYGEVESYKPRARRQLFSIYDKDQLITKGYFVYFEIDQAHAPNQVMCVTLEGHRHIYSNVRELISNNKIEWWIKKLFATHNLDNTEVMKYAMNLLTNHGIKTDNNAYYIGTFNNENNSFDKEISAMKKDLVIACLLFAFASEKLELPSTTEESEENKEVDETQEIEFVSNFSFKDIYEIIIDSQFTFSLDIIRDFHLNLTALDDKHFVILNGISGTGKTQLCRLYANAVYGLDYESENPYLTIIPVRPDWMDATALFGYYSSFEKKYVMTEFLQVLLSAQREREKPHFIVLDEMNLARVEYYLSDYLSAVESRKEILLHNREDVKDIPQKISIPPNVYVLGTINVDETTHSLSDKVLDRAFVMTLSDVDFENFWSTLDQSVKVLINNEFDILTGIHSDLKSFDLHFGYRTMNEMINKLVRNKELDEDFGLDAMSALDRVISEKILPKLRGDERITELLTTLKSKFLDYFGEESQSCSHIVRMEKELERYGATQFWR
ncbi:AAA family ATPase [Fictibacillus sp. WQ 8-8]|uniref:McrB family protein n=1 Tax=Fictibacillus sp. WQ 8-8 TaxID=2938788 RepID=UPI00210F1B22|nr:AAA family ATPase [Fictibacillus sp. WQ 8-8]MCQ6265124.1 AAA family ATPase [Fictibacillus sp. WQ 8-8]